MRIASFEKLQELIWPVSSFNFVWTIMVDNVLSDVLDITSSAANELFRYLSYDSLRRSIPIESEIRIRKVREAMDDNFVCLREKVSAGNAVSVFRLSDGFGRKGKCQPSARRPKGSRAKERGKAPLSDQFSDHLRPQGHDRRLHKK
jgi:hypothetical protein